MKEIALSNGEQDAALAYDHAAVERFGKFASLNFPQGVTE